MPVTVVGNRIRVTAVLSAGLTSTVMNVYHLEVTDLADGGTNEFEIMTDIAAWMDGCYNAIAAMYSTDVTAVEIRGYNETEDFPMPTVFFPSFTGGTFSGETAPYGVCAQLVLRTGVSRVVGRKYLGPLAEQAFTDGLLNTDILDDIIAYAAALAEGVTGAAYDNFARFGIAAASGVVHGVTGFSIASVPAYQRRRKQGRGI